MKKSRSTGTPGQLDHEAPAEASRWFSRRILVVDADDAMSQVVCDRLELHGYTVRRAATGSEATQIVVVQNWFEELKRLAPIQP